MTVTTTVTCPLERFPYKGIAELDRDLTAVPNAELVASALGVAVSDGDAGGQLLVLNVTLPPGFAYYLVEASFELTSAAGVNFEDYARMGASNTTSTPDRVFFSALEGRSVTAGSGNNPTKVYNLDRMRSPTVLLPSDQPAAPGLIGTKVSNTTGSETGYTCGYSFRLLEFEIAQIYDYAVNTPQLIR